VTPGKRGGPAGLPLGDIAFSGAAAAIVSAVARILGSDGGEIALPLSPERTLAVLRGKAASR
jgi:CO/xanthine dehydrogenase Mo-binding subunit